MGVHPSYGKGLHALLWPCSRAVCEKIISGMPKYFNCLILIVRTQLTNVAAGRGLGTHGATRWTVQQSTT